MHSSTSTPSGASALPARALLSALSHGSSWSGATSSAASRSAASTLDAWPLISHGALDRSGVCALSFSSSAPLLSRLYARVTAQLEGGHSADCWAALQAIRHIADSAPAVPEQDGAAESHTEEDSASAGSALLRPHLERWVKFLCRLLRQLLEPRLSPAGSGPGPGALPPMHPLLSLAAFESLTALLTRAQATWPDARREISASTLPALVPLALKMIARSDTHAQARAADKVAGGSSAPSLGAWPFPPPSALVRSLSLLLSLVREWKHSLRAFAERIVSATLPYLAHEDDEVREVTSDLLASVSMLQSGAAAAKLKEKERAQALASATGTDGAEDGDDMGASEAEARASALALQSQSNRAVVPSDPWSTLMQQCINALHARVDEMEDAADALAATHGADGAAHEWKALARCTDVCLPLTAQTLPVAASAAASAPFARAHTLALEVQGLFSLLQALLSRDLFSRMHVPAGAAAVSATVPLPTLSLLALMRRLARVELNPHALQHITGRPLTRAGLLLLLPRTLESACDTLESLLALGGHALMPHVASIADWLRELLTRNSCASGGAPGGSSAGGASACPRLLSRLYALSSSLLRRFGAGSLLLSFALPLLDQSLADAERLVRAKNLQAQANRNAASMGAFTGAHMAASMSAKEARRASGGGAAAGGTSKQSSQADPAALFVETHSFGVLSVLGVSALECVASILEVAGAALPLTARVQADRSLAAIAMALQAGSWHVCASYRVRVYQCLHASLLTPAASSLSGSAGGAPRSSTASSGAHGLLSSFALLPYASRLFSHALAHDPSAQVAAVAAQALRLAAALTHPRALALHSGARSFVQHVQEGGDGLGGLDPLGAEDADDESANRVAKGMVRGRDGSLYMSQQQLQSQEVEREEQEEPAQPYDPAGFESASSSAAASVSGNAPSRLAGSKRPRDESDSSDAHAAAFSAAAEPASKRAYVQQEHESAAAAQQQQGESREDEVSSSDALAGASSAASASVPAAAHDDDEAAAEDAADEDEADEDAAVMVMADGPDDGDAEQASLWQL